MEAHNYVVVLEDHSELTSAARTAAESIGFEADTFCMVPDMLNFSREHKVVAIFIDLVLHDADAVEAIRKLSEEKFEGKVCLYTDHADAKVVMTVHRLGLSYGLDMVGPMPKPLKEEQLTDMMYSLWHASYSINESDLKRAIIEGELIPYFQPKIRLAGTDGSSPIVEAEALVRWNHPALGLVSPGVFVPLAEKSDLIGGLTNTMVSQSIEQIHQWRKAGVNIKVGVNFSLHNFDDLTLPDRLLSDCLKADVPPENFVIEITETAAMGDSLNLANILTRLRIKGFELAMDDFGTGYSSLVQLYRMPFSELKIDQSFLMESDESEEARIIVRSILSLAQNLGLSSCAEGVETSTSVDFCREIGCDKLQGYFISKPMAAETTTRFIEHWDVDLGLIAS